MAGRTKGEGMSGHTGAVPGTTQTGECSSERSSGVGVASPNAQPGFMPPSPAWPLVSYLQLGALPTAVGCARWHTRALLAEWGLTGQEELAEVTELLVSELLTNAYQTTVERDLHTPIALRLSSNREHVLIEVWDSNPTAPTAPSSELPPDDAVNGRGLFLVHSLAARWSWYSLRYWGGKVIWAEVAP